MDLRLFSYVITHDTGFAPNPYGGFLTLATCKPKIRAAAQPGDWLMGTGSALAVGNGRVVYAAQISEVLPIVNYGVDARFEIKRPSPSKDRWRILGDNIYAPDPDGTLKQRRNPFHSGKDVERDLSGLNVLICERFWYFGSSAPELPAHLLATVKRGPGHRCVKSPDLLSEVIGWLHLYPQGIVGTPFRN
jgi:hypothetical protein